MRAMNSYYYDFKLDKNAPHKISIESYLEKQKLVLMVIDMQNYMTRHKYTGKWSSGGSDDYYYNRCENIVIPNLIKLINLFRESNMKVIYTRIASMDENFSDAPSTSKKNLVDDDNIDIEGKRWTLHFNDEASLIDERIKPKENDIVVLKTGSGAFCSSEMDLILRANNISRIIFTGGLTDACVSSTARQAWDRGYLCTVAEDACIASNKDDHDAEIKILGKYYAWITDTNNLISKITAKS
ncbi:MAG: cysteine hydrolase [Actinobacteria bacterium]|nr:cysteine hydrolase [Cyanobacteriota bacterium]MCL6087262.1 cysteine hydrolase [Actinomycetota bacterium]